MISRDDYNNSPPITGNKRVWFLNGDLVRVHHINRAGGIVSVYNINKDRLESCLVGDFKKNRERAFSVNDTAKLVNRHRKHMPRLMKSERIPLPTGASKDKERGWQIRAYYSESQVYEIRDILASYHIGSPRKDGLITNNITPSRQELTRRMGSGILTYTKTEDGQFIPLWTETV
jgi:hypothetical protein